MPAATIYGSTTVHTVTRGLVLTHIVVLAIGYWLDRYDEALLHENIVYLKRAYDDGRFTSRWAFVWGSAYVLYFVGLAGLFFMAAWSRWLFTATWLTIVLYPVSDWSLVTINADVLRVPWKILEAVSGATLAIIWLNAWSSPGRSAEASPVNVESPR